VFICPRSRTAAAIRGCIRAHPAWRRNHPTPRYSIATSQRELHALAEVIAGLSVAGQRIRGLRVAREIQWGICIGATGNPNKNTNAVTTFIDVTFAPARRGYVVAPYNRKSWQKGSKALQ
jgi:hypothetical protein